jgi:hypothetical protein
MSELQISKAKSFRGNGSRSRQHIPYVAKWNWELFLWGGCPCGFCDESWLCIYGVVFRERWKLAIIGDFDPRFLKASPFLFKDRLESFEVSLFHLGYSNTSEWPVMEGKLRKELDNNSMWSYGRIRVMIAVLILIPCGPLPCQMGYSWEVTYSACLRVSLH